MLSSGLPLSGQYDIARPEPGLGRRPGFVDGRDQRPGRLLHAERFGDLRRHRLELGTDIGPLEEIEPRLGRVGEGPHHVGRDGEADADRTAAAAIDSRVDADQLATHVDQRAAGIAGIDGGIGLDEEAGIGNADMAAGKRGNDAAGGGLADAERVADGQHQVADLERVGIADGDDRKRLVGGDLEHGEVERLVLEQNLAGEFAPVRGRDLDLVGVLDDMEIGDDDAVGSTSTPEPSEDCARGCERPKNSSKNGSPSKGDVTLAVCEA